MSTTPRETGMRHVSWVRITTTVPGTARAEAVGIGHRLPRVVPISMAAAAELASKGIPFAFRRSVRDHPAGKGSA